MNKKNLIGIILIIILLIIGVSYFVFGKNFIYKEGKIYKISDLEESTSFVTASKSGNMDEAIRIAQDIVNKKPKDLNSMLNLAEAYVNKASLDNEELEYAPKALEIVDNVLTIDPNNFEAYRIKGYANEILQNFDNAIVSYNKAIEINSKTNAKIYNSRGHAYELMGKYQEALDDYLKGYEIDSDDAGIQMNLARMYLSKDDEIKAREFADKVINNKNDNVLYYIKASAYSVLGQLDLNKNNYEEAINDFGKATKILPSFVSGYIGQAQAALSSSEKISNENKIIIYNALTNAIELNPNSSWAYYLFGQFYEKQQDYKNALDNYEKALSVVKSDLAIDLGARESVSKNYQEKIDFINNKLKK